MFLEILVSLILEYEYVHSKRMKRKQKERLSHYVSFTGGRCGLMKEQPMQFVLHVFIPHRGRRFLRWFCNFILIFGL